jgi:Fusaric acid resistance protein family
VPRNFHCSPWPSRPSSSVATIAKTLPNPIVAALGRLNLIFILILVSPSNPQSYDPNEFLFSVLFLCAGIALLLAAQLLVPPISGERRQRWLLAAARRELEHLLSYRDRRWAPEEAMFRDAVRIGYLAVATSAGPQQHALFSETLSYFDEAAAIRLRYVGPRVEQAK